MNYFCILLITITAIFANGSTLKYSGKNHVPLLIKDNNMQYSADSSFTIQAWLKPGKLDASGKFSINAPHTILCKGSIRDGNFNYALRVKARYLELLIYSNGLQVIPMRRKLPMGKWIHMSVVYNAAESIVAFYINADDKTQGGMKEVVKVNKIGALKVNSLPLFIGADGNVKGEKGAKAYRSFPGEIEDIKFSKKVLKIEQLAFKDSVKQHSPLGGIYMIGDWEAGDAVDEKKSKRAIYTTIPFNKFKFTDIQEIKFSPEKIKSFLKFEFDAGQTDRFGQPDHHLGLVIKYHDTLDRTATLRSWMGYFGKTPEQNPWNKLVYQQNLLGFIGGLEDGMERECYVIIERTPLMRVVAKDGKLQFRIDSHKAFPVKSIKLFTVSDEELKQWKDARRKAVFKLYGFNFSKISQIGKPDNSKLKSVAGIKFFESPPLQTVYPELPAFGKNLEKLNFYACPGQFQPASFGICPDKNIKDFDIKVSDLKSENGQLVKSSNITVTIARIIVSSEASFLRPGTYAKLIPYNLEPFEYNKTLFANQSRWVWLTVQVPEDAVAGEYHGTAVISVSGKNIKEVPLKLQIWPFKLEESRMQFSMFPSSLPLIGNEDVLEKALLDMKQHGMTGFCVGGTLAPQVAVDTGKGGSYNIDFTRTDKIMSMLHKYGLDKHYVIFNFNFMEKAETLAGPGASESQIDNAAQNIVADIMAHAKAANWPKLLWFTLDEPSEPHRQAITRRTYDIIKKYPENLTFTTCQALSVRKALGPKLDYPCMSVGFETTRLEELEQFRKANPESRFAMYDQFWGDKALCQRAKMWWYWGTDVPENTILTWWAYLAIRDAFYDNLTYSISNWRGLRNVVAHNAGVSPARDGVLGNVVWQNIRLGIDDLRYLQTLQTALKKAEKQSPQDASVKKTRKFISKLRSNFGVSAKKFASENIMKAYPDYVFDAAHRSWPVFRINVDYNYNKFENFRIQAAELIVDLNKISEK